MEVNHFPLTTLCLIVVMMCFLLLVYSNTVCHYCDKLILTHCLLCQKLNFLSGCKTEV
jgi:hypothetical protein